METKWNTLLKALDFAYGTTDRSASRFKTISQDFDNFRQEQVVSLEYRWRRGGAAKSLKHDKKQNDLNKAELAMKKQQYDLLKQINSVA